MLYLGVLLMNHWFRQRLGIEQATSHYLTQWWLGTPTHILAEIHYVDVIISAIASQMTGVTIVYRTVCSGVNQRKHQSSASLAFVRGILRWPVNSPNKRPVTRKILPFDDVIMNYGKSLHAALSSVAKLHSTLCLIHIAVPRRSFMYEWYCGDFCSM